MLADLVLLDWEAVTRPWQDPSMPLVDVLLRRAKAGAVETVLIGGRTVYHAGRFAALDRAAVLDEIAAALARPDTPHEARLRALSRDLLAPVARFYEGWLD
jgi:hypothetical protein